MIPTINMSRSNSADNGHENRAWGLGVKEKEDLRTTYRSLLRLSRVDTDDFGG